MTRTTAQRTGLLLLALVSVGDIATLFLTDGKTPPWAVSALGAVLGVMSLVLVARALRGDSRLRLLIVLRSLSAATALPAFFVSDVPVAAKGGAAAVVAVTALGILLLATPSRESVTA